MWKLAFKLLAPGAAVYFMNLAALKLGLYSAWPQIDIPFHVMGGMAIGYLAVVAWQTGLGYPRATLSSIPAPIVFLTLLGFVGLVGIAWEWHEFIIDAAARANHWSFIPSQPGVGDTMADLFFDLSGGAVVILGHLLISKRK